MPAYLADCLPVDYTRPESGDRFLRWVFVALMGRKEGEK